MKKLFLAGCLLLLSTELLTVFLIMPMPGSQQTDSIALAYFLFRYRWIVRIISGLIMLAGVRSAFHLGQKWWSILLLLVVSGVTYLCNVPLRADHIFLPMRSKVFGKDRQSSQDSLMAVLGVSVGTEARAYPIRYLAYHHQIIDTVGGKRIMVTYCSVCRTGRVYAPETQGQPEQFRLVGMDQYNALFEDKRTRSWWRQSTGICAAGPLRGQQLEEIPSTQASWANWLQVYPHSLLLQADSSFLEEYDLDGKYERGENHGGLTGTDTLSWKPKSWIIGIELDGLSKAYDWKHLQRNRLVRDTLGSKKLLILLAQDGINFMALQVPSVEGSVFRNDSLLTPFGQFSFSTLQQMPDSSVVQTIPSYQEYWHSWKTFHPNTLQYPGEMPKKQRHR